MKKYISIAIGFFMTLSYFSCNSDLDTAPTGQTPPEQVFSSIENAELAVNGLGLLMAKQYLGSQGFNGEGTIKLFYGEYPSNNFVKDLPGWAAIINLTYTTNITSIYLYYPWYYYYRIIGDANVILDNIDNISDFENEKLNIKAKCLTYRAYAYFMMSQLYSKRWSESQNGASSGLILRLNSKTEDQMALSTLAQTYAQIYDDLDTAISYFNQSKIDREDFYDIGIEVAQAIYARAALTREDFAKAATMAAEARKNYPLMSNDDLMKGFFDPTSEWIWGSYGSTEQNLYYYSYQAYMAYNTSGSIIRLYPNMITKELYAQIPKTDVRRRWWVYPGDDVTTPGPVTSATVDADIRKNYPAIPSNATTSYYMQFKIGASALPGVGNMCHIRSSEMILVEAEALVRQNAGKDEQARKLMLELNKDSGRNPEYTLTKSGTELLEEIWKYRSIELWGEGFEWFDYKRTGRAVKRTDRAAKGSYISSLAVTINPNQANDWVWAVPSRETDYNQLAKLPEPAN
ncbi:RagB/SusD family nutrient uptake outer membrane protein [Dysgonomonas sp.]